MKVYLTLEYAADVWVMNTLALEHYLWSTKGCNQDTFDQLLYVQSAIIHVEGVFYSFHVNSFSMLERSYFVCFSSFSSQPRGDSRQIFSSVIDDYLYRALMQLIHVLQFHFSHTELSLNSRCTTIHKSLTEINILSLETIHG